ncbi:DUF4279 domain-containing protein [Ureibacillus sp. Re31]|uniref:DUF4279 domain-containing protein n=1 Tax=Ureibacillus galli TaxID=2762222 RepID=A0ABR8XE65_9BACL|nr:DUF4279 domain-containing protein [Ureibacillus galli]
MDKFTEELGIKPTETYKKGDPYIRGKRKSTRFETVWEIEQARLNYFMMMMKINRYLNP